MKKVISVLLCLLLIVTFASCAKKKEKKQDTQNTGIISIAETGKITEAEFAVGNDLSLLKEKMDTQRNEHAGEEHGYGESHDLMMHKEGNTFSYYTDSSISYYYRSNNKEAGVAAIISYDAAFGFTVGLTNKYDITTAISDTPVVSKATEKQTFFLLFALEDCEILTYKAGKYNLNFYFSNGLLLCTALVNPELWV